MRACTRAARSSLKSARRIPACCAPVSAASVAVNRSSSALAASARPQRQLTTSAQLSATATTAQSSLNDPQDDAAQQQLDLGNQALQTGDLDTAGKHYKKSLEIKPTSIGHYNMGVVLYSQSDLAGAIKEFEASLTLFDPSIKPPPIPDDINEPFAPLTPAQQTLADTHMNLGAAYILSTPPRPDKALEHLQRALMMNPEDGEVCFNLAAVLEATGEEEEAMLAYQKAEKLGIERAQVNIRNLGAKLLAKARKEEEEKEAQTSKAKADE
ncbi:hypothetical protein OIV83_004040 [Microbotryomycetes sp. JL201]|nr:hypothetical protein OIV83_004040 [Microbotryomycetes sp. JL201]